MRHRHSLNKLVFVSLESEANVVRLTFSSGASGTVFRGTDAIEDRCILVTGNGIEVHSSIGHSVPANSVRVRMAALGVLKRDRAAPFRVLSGDLTGRRLELGCHCLSLEHPIVRGGVLVHRGVTGIAESCFSRGNFVRVRAPAFVGSAPRNTHSCLIPSHVRGNDFFTLPRSPRLCGRLLVLSNFSHCVRLTHYCHSRSLHTSHRPRFARVSLRVSFIRVRSIFSVTRNFMGHLFGRILGIRVPAPLPHLACARTVGSCNSSGPSAHFSVGVGSLSSVMRGYNFSIFTSAIGGNNAMHTVATGSTTDICAEGRVSGLARRTGNVNTGNLTFVH